MCLGQSNSACTICVNNNKLKTRATATAPAFTGGLPRTMLTLSRPSTATSTNTTAKSYNSHEERGSCSGQASKESRGATTAPNLVVSRRTVAPMNRVRCVTGLTPIFNRPYRGWKTDAAKSDISNRWYMHNLVVHAGCSLIFGNNWLQLLVMAGL